MSCIVCGQCVEKGSGHGRCRACHRRLDNLIRRMLDDGVEGPEIATETGLTQAAVHQRVHRMKKRTMKAEVRHG